MNIARFLSEERVDLELDRLIQQGEGGPELGYEDLVRHMADLLARSTDVVNERKLVTDLVNRERRASSLLERGVCMPHVRTLQARKLIMAVGVSHAGLPLTTPDGEAVRLVLAFVGPPYDDRLYLQAYKRLSEQLTTPGWIEELTGADLPGEVLRALSRG